MNTISLNRNLNEAFKQVQRLPLLTSVMTAGQPAPQAYQAAPARRETRGANCGAVPTATARQLPRPGANPDIGERALVAILGLCALFCVVQTFATVIAWSPNAPQLTARVAQGFA
jgi:hypothetical protein